MEERGSTMTDHAGILARYKHFRQVGIRLNDRLVKSLPKSVLLEGAERLGILKKGVLVMDSQAMTPILLDYCIYDVRRGRNAVETSPGGISPRA